MLIYVFNSSLNNMLLENIVFTNENGFNDKQSFLTAKLDKIHGIQLAICCIGVTAHTLQPSTLYRMLKVA
ncbi:MAG: hypothetical protein HQK52_15310 [Oligoflexia bacterium]|nr:hypothetical protein [Oligoflexia bacterium]